MRVCVSEQETLQLRYKLLVMKYNPFHNTTSRKGETQIIWNLSLVVNIIKSAVYKH